MAIMSLANQTLGMVVGLFRPQLEGEMPKLCALPIPGSKGDVIFVNPNLVRFIRAGSPGNALLVFDNEHSMPVALPVETVRAQLDKAMNEE